MKTRLLSKSVGVSLVVMGVSAVTLVVLAQDRAEMAKRREDLLGRLEKTAKQYLNVPHNDGLFLKMMAAAKGAKGALELGSSNGYSAIWIGSALEQTGGHLWTIEMDPKRVRECRGNLKEAGLDKVVTCIEGDVFKGIPELEGPFDFVFADIADVWPEKQFELVFPKRAEGGVIVQHDATLLAAQVKNYVEIVTKHPELDTVVVNTPGGYGFVLSIRKPRERADR